MLNLLPHEDKFFLKREFQTRVLVVILAFLLVTLLAGFLYLIPSFLLSKSKTVNALMKRKEMEKAIASETQDTIHTEVKKVREEIALLEPSPNSVSFSHFVQQVIADRAVGIAILSFSMQKSGDGTGVLSVNGKAASRSALLSFIDRLKKEDGVTRVDSPVSNFAKNSDIDFSISIYRPSF
jgi:hypothetical protein